ncbi:MAG: carboxypeptidase regulatory-like domain-containing protein [bacterium]
MTRRINFTLECEGENLCISGRVVDDSTGEAINDAFIVAMMIGRPYARYAFSGRDGRYEICGLIPGKYVVFAHAGGYIGEFYDNVYRWEHATPVMPPEDDIDFSLGRRRRLNRLVSGKVFCGTGPATRAMVYAYDSGMAAFGQVPVSSALTEADGSYTLEGLSAGTYMITATRPGDPTTSYPDLVTVGPNAVEGIDIHLGATMVRGGAVSRADAREVLLKTMPNPFRNKTRFSFTIPNTSDVRLDIFDLSGRLVATLVDENLPEGEHTAEWSAQGVPSGVYVSKLSCSGVSVVRKIVLAR